MLAWLTTFGLRWKIYAISIGVFALTALSLWAALRFSLRRARTAEARAKGLEQARSTEKRIRTRQDALRLQQQRLRDQLKAHKNRDAFEQGWGPWVACLRSGPSWPSA